MIPQIAAAGQTSTPDVPQEPSDDLIRRAWSRGRNTAAILRCVARLDQMAPYDRALFTVALRLEEGELPWIEQHGFARFDSADPADYRVIAPEAEKGDDHDDAHEGSPAGSAARATEGSARRRAAADAEKAEAGPAVRGDGDDRRIYSHVGEVMDEDRWELGVMFPGFSPPVLDPALGLFFREGTLQPLRWYPARFAVRLYYERSPWLLPIVRIRPEPPPKTPHMFRMVRNDVGFRAVCYTFAPDGTIARGRSWDDTATEVLRQVVVWLLRYLVWRRFKFFPGVDVAHDDAELLRTVDAQDPCPYHADRPYGRCCRPKHEAAAAKRTQRAAANPERRYGILDPRTRR